MRENKRMDENGEMCVQTINEIEAPEIQRISNIKLAFILYSNEHY
jgi:hypothetical protein